jgi:uncharacterized lipoprotein YehR (DUF1307 family)
MLMIAPEEEWYTRIEKEYIFSGNVPLDRKGELVLAFNLGCVTLETDNKTTIVFTENYKNIKGETEKMELFKRVYFSDVEFKKIDSMFLNIFGVKKINRNNIKNQPIKNFPSKYPELTRAIREARVEINGVVYYDIEKLSYVYDRLPEEVKINYDKLKELMEEKTPSSSIQKEGYVIRSVPENYKIKKYSRG